MSQLALDLGVPSTLVTEAVYARCLSALKDARVRASKVLKGPTAKYDGDRKQFIEQIRQALYASKICSYAQGFVQLQAAADGARLAAELRQHRPAVARRLHHSRRVPRSHQGSVRRRSEARKPAARAVLHARPSPKAQDAWRHVVATAAAAGHPGARRSPRRWPTTTATASALPANLLQAQRDYFGAHTYERIDKPGTFHTDWIRQRRQPE